MIKQEQPKTEKAREKVLSIFGYTSEDLNCANARTALTEVYDDDSNGEPVNFIELFINNCSVEEFASIKKMYLGWSLTQEPCK